ncbi:MAG TPA: oxidoreductase [Pseudonocardiaceae bacterium]|jgi:NAD(P)-dependent dehydrogenase (short-subunit alcohol dehydrogenase family)|nr:oxidoreductase [Pseudonocardiaceae bacterium]
MSTSNKVALVTGASSGIGEAGARKLNELGYTVYGAARRVERMKGLADAGVHVLAMDVTDAESMTEGVKRIIDENGRIDVLVNNAGYGSYGAVEDVPLDEARAQFEVNVFGAAQLIQLVTPHMRAQGSGRIINITSMGGKIYTPFGGWYHGTKFALEALSDSLRNELRPFGVDVVVIEPGGIRTEWGGIAADNLRQTSGEGAYAKPVARMATMMGRDGLGSDPKVIANAIARAATARRPRTRYAVGMGAKPAIFLRWLLPDRAFDGLIRLGLG